VKLEVVVKAPCGEIDEIGNGQRCFFAEKLEPDVALSGLDAGDKRWVVRHGYVPRFMIRE
jgi:hypothetical protein